MTKEDIRELLVSVDPDIKYKFSMSDADSYSYWEDTQRLPLIADDEHKEAWRFYVHHFTKQEDDPVATAFFQALDQEPGITVSWTKGPREPDTGYIQHIFTCEGY